MTCCLHVSPPILWIFDSRVSVHLPNVAAKQEAFEESIKLKNQFRNLDEDEIEFLDSVLESTRAKEEAVKRETTEQLDIFRRQQEEADKVILAEGGGTEGGTGETKAASPTAEGSAWAVNARKRKRAKEKEGLKGVKLRKSSSTVETPKELECASPDVQEKKAITPAEDTRERDEVLSGIAATDKSPAETVISHPTQPDKASATATTKQASGTISKSAATAGLGLGGYSSDEDD